MTLKMLEKAVKALKPKEQRKFLSDLPNLIHLEDDPSSFDISRLAKKSRSFRFLARKKEDIYSLKDGRPV